MSVNPSDYAETRAWCSAPDCRRQATGTIRLTGEPELARLGCAMHNYTMAGRWVCPRGHWHRASETEGRECPGDLEAGGWDLRHTPEEREGWGRR
jgi:hypothetical protein